MTRRRGNNRVEWCSSPVTIPGVRLIDYEKEFAFQVYCADWLRKQFELTGERIYANWHHSANERSNCREGFLAKMMGQQSGMLDLVQFEYRIAIELKVLGGSLSAKQAYWIDYLRGIGWTAEVVANFGRFVEIIGHGAKTHGQ